MKKIFLVLFLLQISTLVQANEYQKMFSCSQALSSEGQFSNKAITKNLAVLPGKNKGADGVDLFLHDQIYFCKLPAKHFSKNIQEKVYKLNLSVPRQKPIYVSYVRPTGEAPNLEIIDWNTNMDFSQDQSSWKKLQKTSCKLATDPHSEKVLADFLRREISHVHDKSSGPKFSLYSKGSVASLRLCEKSFLLKTVSDNEIKKFEARVPANNN